MTTQFAGANRAQSRAPNVKLGNTKACLEMLRGAIAKRAYQIYLGSGCRPGCDCVNWQLAENEVLQPLRCCGILDAKDEAVISILFSGICKNEIEEIQVCVEPHRLVLVGKRELSPTSGEDTAIYRVLPLKDEFDPSSVKLDLKHRNALFELRIHKAGAHPLVKAHAA